MSPTDEARWERFLADTARAEALPRPVGLGAADFPTVLTRVVRDTVEALGVRPEWAPRVVECLQHRAPSEPVTSADSYLRALRRDTVDTLWRLGALS